MEENINPEIPETNLSEGNAYRPLKIENELASNLLEMAKWAKYLSYIGIAIVALYAALSIFSIVIGIISPEFMGDQTNPFFLAFQMLIGAGIYFFPVYFLYKGSTNLIEGFDNANRAQFSLGARNLKSHFKFFGIYTIIGGSITLIILILATVIGAGAFLIK